MGIYFCIDLKSFFASVECVERKLDPFQTNLVVADSSRGKGTICLAITPHMKLLGIKNRCRVYEIPDNVKYIVAKPRMSKYIEYSANIYAIYLKYFSKEDIHVYSIDEAFMDVTNYLHLYNMHPLTLAKKIMNDIYQTYGITATCGIGTNLYLTKIALDIMSKHSAENIGILNEEKYREKLWHHKNLTDFWQIGRGIERRLHKLNLYDMYDVAHCKEEKLYKETRDNYLKNNKLMINQTYLDNLKMIFTRSYTKGFIFHDLEVTNDKSPNHIGIKVGKVIEYKNNLIKIKLSDDISIHDGLRIINNNLEYLYSLHMTKRKKWHYQFH